MGCRIPNLYKTGIGIRFVVLMFFSKTLTYKGYYVAPLFQYFLVDQKRLVGIVANDMGRYFMPVDKNALVFEYAFRKQSNACIIGKFGQIKFAPHSNQTVGIGSPVLMFYAEGIFRCAMVDFEGVSEVLDSEVMVASLRLLIAMR